MLYIHHMRFSLLSVLITSVLTAAVPAPKQFTPHYLGQSGAQGSLNLIAPDQSGHLFMVSTATNAAGARVLRAIKTDSNGAVLAQFDFGGTGFDSAFAAAVDPQGNLVIGGSTSSADFPLVNPLYQSGNGFIIRLDSGLTKILYSSHFAGGTIIQGLAFDSAGNIYLTGTVGTGLPVTAGALQSQPATSTLSFAIITNGFVAEISAAGDKLIYATYYSAAGITCTDRCGGGPHPVGPAIYTIPTTIAVDSTGSAIIGGYTDTNNLAVTPGAYATQCNCADSWASAFIAKFAPGGTKLVWGTYIPYAVPPQEAAVIPTITISALTLDSTNNVVFAGNTPTGFPTTPGALQPNFPPMPGPIFGIPTAGFVAKLDSAGSKLIWSTYFGGNAIGNNVNFVRPGGVASITLDSAGSIWLSGTSAVSNLPGIIAPAAIGQNFIASVSPDGATVQSLNTAPYGSAGGPLAITSLGTLAILGGQNSFLTASSTAGPSLIGIVESSGYQITRKVSPRDLVSLYGIGIGPATPSGAQVSNSAVSRSLGGVQVLFDGAPAALLYAGSTQINAIVPSGVASRTSTFVQIVTPTGTLDGFNLAVQPVSPRVLTDVSNAALALNANGTINSATNPASLGSIVTVYMTGGGANSTDPDNQVTSFPSDPIYPLSVLSNVNVIRTGELSLEVDFAGDAVGIVNGVMQINFRLPASTPIGFLEPLLFNVLLDGVQSDSFAIYAH
jgi:uncharacterized protein (TIGR03437 family)